MDFKQYTFEEYYPSNNDGSIKKIALHLKNQKDKVLDFKGREFYFENGVSPIIIDNCENIILRNFSIDFIHTQHFEGDILSVGENYFTVKAADGYTINIKDNRLLVSTSGGEYLLDGFLGQEFSLEKKSPYPTSNNMPIRFVSENKVPEEFKAGILYIRLSQRLDGVVKFSLVEGSRGKIQAHVGGKLIFRLTNRNDSAIFITDSKNIKLENISIYRSPSMGIIAQLSENITLNNIMVKCKENRASLISTNTDATHFTNCYGKIQIQNCEFYNMMDDAGNVHGIYGRIVEVCGNIAKIRLMHSQQKGVRFIRENDVVKFLSEENHQIKKVLKAKKSNLSDDKEYLIVVFVEQLVGIEVGDIVDNITAMPEVYISNCRTGNNRPRGFLLTSGKKTIVENCFFENSSYAIHITSDSKNWYESGDVNEIIIKNNHFKCCNYSSGTATIGIQPALNKEGVYIHHNISILNNLVEMEGHGFVDAYGVDGLRIEGNKIIEISPLLDDNIQINNCKNVVVQNN